jgi:hypothetical protein
MQNTSKTKSNTRKPASDKQRETIALSDLDAPDEVVGGVGLLIERPLLSESEPNDVFTTKIDW